MSKVSELVKDKEITSKDLEGLEMVKEFVSTGDLDKCQNCFDSINTKNLPAESWTSILYCWKCDHITRIVHADGMSGNHDNTFNVYKG